MRRVPFLLFAAALLAASSAPAVPVGDAYQTALDAPPPRPSWNRPARGVPVSPRARVFLLRWNPGISSYTPEEFADTVARWRRGGGDGFNWSIREIDKVRAGDIALFCRVGTDADRIDGVGVFTGRTAVGASWRGDGTRVGYADLVLDFVQDPALPLLLPADDLARRFPAIDWHGGSSGVALPEPVAEELACCVSQRLSSLIPAASAGKRARRAARLWHLACRLLTGACPELFERLSAWVPPVAADAFSPPEGEGMRIGFDPARVSPAGFSARDLRPLVRPRFRPAGGDGAPGAE